MHRRAGATMARLVGLDPMAAPGTVAELDEFMTAMLPKLALGTDTLWFRDMILPSGIPLKPGDVLEHLFTWGAIALFEADHHALYGLRWNPVRELVITTAVKAVIDAAATTTLEQAIPLIRRYVDEHAFGARRRRVDPTLSHDLSHGDPSHDDPSHDDPARDEPVGALPTSGSD